MVLDGSISLLKAVVSNFKYSQTANYETGAGLLLEFAQVLEFNGSAESADAQQVIVKATELSRTLASQSLRWWYQLENEGHALPSAIRERQCLLDGCFAKMKDMLAEQIAKLKVSVFVFSCFRLEVNL